MECDPEGYIVPTLLAEDNNPELAAAKSAAQHAALLPLMSRARVQWCGIMRGRARVDSLDVPLSVWRLGHLTWLGIGGEPTVELGPRMRRELSEAEAEAAAADVEAGALVEPGLSVGARHFWVTGYCDNVVSYLPSDKVLSEGG
jgi:hypothetical protein